MFNHPVDLLPNLETLTLGYSFNMSIKFLSKSLIKLTIGRGVFNRPVPPLPCLTHLTIGSTQFNQTIPAHPLLTHLCIKSPVFNQSLDHLSSSIISLELCAGVQLPALPSLTNLNCDGASITSLPDSLTSLICKNTSPASMSFVYRSSISSLSLVLSRDQPVPPLPQSLRTLVLAGVRDTELNDLPASLTRLDCDRSSICPVNHFHTSLTHLRFSCDQPIDRLPPNLTHLSFVSSFNQSITGKLPQTLQSLELGFSFCQSLRSLPPSLKSLSGSSFFFVLLFFFSFILFVLPSHPIHLSLPADWVS